MHAHRRLAVSQLTLLLAVLALPFCLGCPPERSEPARDTAATVDADTSAVSTQTALALAEELAAGEEPLDPAMTAAGNAAIIQGNAAVALGTCGTVSLSGTTVTVAFAVTGCTLPSGITATGTISLSASVAAGTATVDVQFDRVRIGSYGIDGTASFSTTNGTSYAVMLDLMSEARSISGDRTVSASLTSLIVSGTLTTQRIGGTALMLTIAGLVWNRGDCYPSAGSITVGAGALEQTVTFASTTASTGVVTITFGRATTTETLPAYGSCPGA